MTESLKITGRQKCVKGIERLGEEVCRSTSRPNKSLRPSLNSSLLRTVTSIFRQRMGPDQAGAVKKHVKFIVRDSQYGHMRCWKPGLGKE